MIRRLRAWLHRECWRVWVHPETAEEFLFLPDPVVPDMDPHPVDGRLLIPCGSELVLRKEAVADLSPLEYERGSAGRKHKTSGRAFR